jgi:hypothetical protein
VGKSSWIVSRKVREGSGLPCGLLRNLQSVCWSFCHVMNVVDEFSEHNKDTLITMLLGISAAALVRKETEPATTEPVKKIGTDPGCEACDPNSISASFEVYVCCSSGLG